MNALRQEVIISITTKINEEITCHQSTIVYIIELLKPYAEALAPASIDDIIAWIPTAITGKLAETSKQAIIQERERQELLEERRRLGRLVGIKDETVIKQFSKNEAINVIKGAFIKYLIYEILEAAIIVIDYDNTILPWDVQKGIILSEELSKMFGITAESKNELQVTITVGPQQFTYMFTLDFTMGLLLFSAPNVGNIDFNITMFGVKITPDYFLSDTNRFILDPEEEHHTYKYIVSITGFEYEFAFENKDFMQGFATGAMWAGVDHHKYWSNLYHWVLKVVDPNTSEYHPESLVF